MPAPESGAAAAATNTEWQERTAADVTRACSSEPPEAARPPGQRTGGFCQLVRAVGQLLANEPVVFGMSTDPSPQHSLCDWFAECAIVCADAHGPMPTDPLEVKGWMPRIRNKQRIIVTRELLNLFGQ